MHAIKEKLLPMGLLCLLAILTGAITGVITAGFGRILLGIGTLRTTHLLWFLPFLPLAGALMVWAYQKYGKESSQGMGLIFDAATGKADRIPLRLIPLLIGSTWLTHLCGGSAGREGVAVQLGATVAHWTGSHIPLFQRQKSLIRILTISGMAAGFSGLFHAPLAAVCFALEVLVVGKLEYRFDCIGFGNISGDIAGNSCFPDFHFNVDFGRGSWIDRRRFHISVETGETSSCKMVAKSDSSHCHLRCRAGDSAVSLWKRAIFRSGNKFDYPFLQRRYRILV